jgi:serine/threonine-protein kinase
MKNASYDTSLGGTLYHALTGHVPFEAETVEGVLTGHVHTPLTPPNLVRPEISQATSDAIVTAMAKDPEQRFQSYGEFKMALESSRSFLLVEALQQQQLQPPDEGQPLPAPTSWWRKR